MRRSATLIALLLLIALRVGACGDRVSTVETVNRLVDEWVAAWLADDADAVAALFAEDGVYGDASGVERRGREEIAAHVGMVSGYLDEPTERVGDSVEQADGSCTVSIRATYAGFTVESPIVVTLDGDVIARLVWTEPWL